jgi:hypothetical protein
MGSIPIAHSILGLCQHTQDNPPERESITAWEGLGIGRQFHAILVVLDSLWLP